MKKLLLLAVAFVSVSLFIPAPSQAAVDSVHVDGLVLSRCGAQQVYASGTATYATSTRHLVVTFDGAVVLDRHDSPAFWVTGLFPAAVGTHTITASVFAEDSHTTRLATHSTQITVASCATATPTVTPSPAHKEADCCPGLDPVEMAGSKVVKGKVKASQTAATTTTSQPSGLVIPKANIVNVPITAKTGVGLSALGSLSILLGAAAYVTRRG